MGQSFGIECCHARLHTSDDEEDFVWYDADDGEQNEQGSFLLPDADIIEAGVPAEYVEKVAKLRAELKCGAADIEPLCDPITLLRFLVSRNFDVNVAAATYRDAVKWRKEYHVAAIMSIFGGGESYTPDGSPSDLQRTKDWHWKWHWERQTASHEAHLVNQYAFWGRLKQKHPVDGAAILVWRVGTADIGALQRESLLLMCKHALVAHIEDTFEALRAESLKRKDMVRYILIIDAHGISAHFFRHAAVIKDLLSFCMEVYPEMLRSAVVVRAPWIFTKMWNAAQVFMPEQTRRKFLITGTDFAKDLKLHSGLDKEMMPAFLGGSGSDSEVCAAHPVPAGTGRTSPDIVKLCKQVTSKMQTFSTFLGA